MKKKINEIKNGTLEHNPLLKTNNKTVKPHNISSLPSKTTSSLLKDYKTVSLSPKDGYYHPEEMIGGKRNKTMKKCMKKPRKTNKKNVKKSRKTKRSIRR
jgi:uncharacterized protein with WD repeat